MSASVPAAAHHVEVEVVVEHLGDPQVACHQRQDRRLQRTLRRRLEGDDRELGALARHLFERVFCVLGRDEVRAVRPEAPASGGVPGAPLGSDERHLDGQLEQEPRREHLAKHFAKGVSRHVAARAFDEVADGGVVRHRQRRRMLAVQLAETARDAGAFVQDRDEPRVDARHLVAELVGLPQGYLRHREET